MPLYIYKCDKCLKTFEIVQTSFDFFQEKCEDENCDGHLTKQFTSAGASYTLKGKDWCGPKDRS